MCFTCVAIDVTSLKRQLRVLHNVIFNAEFDGDDGEVDDGKYILF